MSRPKSRVVSKDNNLRERETRTLFVFYRDLRLLLARVLPCLLEVQIRSTNNHQHLLLAYLIFLTKSPADSSQFIGRLHFDFKSSHLTIPILRIKWEMHIWWRYIHRNTAHALSGLPTTQPQRDIKQNFLSRFYSK